MRLRATQLPTRLQRGRGHEAAEDTGNVRSSRSQRSGQGSAASQSGPTGSRSGHPGPGWARPAPATRRSGGRRGGTQDVVSWAGAGLGPQHSSFQIARAMRPGPLSERMWVGAPRCRATPASTSRTPFGPHAAAHLPGQVVCSPKSGPVAMRVSNRPWKNGVSCTFPQVSEVLSEPVRPL